jgi:hypothetical protein
MLELKDKCVFESYADEQRQVPVVVARTICHFQLIRVIERSRFKNQFGATTATTKEKTTTNER